MEKPGFHIGGVIDFPFSELLSLETGLFMDTKGFLAKEESPGDSWEERIKLFILPL